MDKSDLVDLQITAISCITIWFRGPGGTTKRELNRVLFFCFVVPDLRSLEWGRNACYQTKKREDLSFFSFVPPQGRAFIASGGAVSGIFVSNSPRSLTFLSIV